MNFWILEFANLNVLFIYLFLAVLGLHSCKGFSSVVASGGYSPVVVCGLLVAVAPLVVEHRLWASAVAARELSSDGSQAPLEHRLSSCDTRASLLHGMWDLPGPGLNLCLWHRQVNSLPLSH